jgi:hypothetical protein
MAEAKIAPAFVPVNEVNVIGWPGELTGAQKDE